MKFDTKILTKTALFDGMTLEQIESLLPCLGAVIKEYEKNQIIFLEGDRATKFGIVLDGSVRIIKEDFNGNRSVLASVERYELFAESYACSDEKYYPVSVVSEGKSVVMVIEIQRIYSSCINSCDIHRLLFRNLMKIIARKNIIFNRKIDFMSRRTTKEKIMAYLYSEAERAGSNSFTIPFDRQALADYLGVERSAMSSEIGKLRDEGVIEVDKSYFKILKNS